ncbi:hypothetical protein [Mycoplasma capricolum]|uniref:hypothetical protein n=1 Tax=Mycoplasma capricolum TaxID=2095 RepID=UPI0004F7AF15|nr:hypothetical protein [Mycoplasma capricolum]WGD33476.1 hypothetical protein Mccp14020TZ_10180 [Mycoplasma capricolum subsp. capripneumoniae]CEA11351.1 hypothetical protein MCCPILRI181_01013 [Mycoplasma capricolum subsp. capripneumoniae]
MKKLIALLTAISVSTAGGFSYIGYKNLSNGTTIDNQENEFKQLEKELKKIQSEIKNREDRVKFLDIKDIEDIKNSNTKIELLKKQEKDIKDRIVEKKR